MQPAAAAEIFKSSLHTLYTQYLAVFPHERKRLTRLKACLDSKRDIHLRSTMEGHVTATAAIFLSEDNTQVFLVHHKALNKWILPGGHYDLEDGYLWQCAKRETMEETGIELGTLDTWHQRNGSIPFDIDIHPIPANPAKSEGWDTGRARYSSFVGRL